MAINHAMMAYKIAPCTLSIISWFLIKMPAPIDEPITNIIAEKKPIFFLVGAV
jgi:hypothetical protein